MVFNRLFKDLFDLNSIVHKVNIIFVKKNTIAKKRKSLDFPFCLLGGQGWIRTIEGLADGFTVRCI